MPLSPEMQDIFKVASGVFWSLTYLLLIYRGFKDRTYGMPLVALTANIAWEFIFAFVRPHDAPQLYVNIAWCLLDAVIVFQALRYGPDELKNLFPRRYFYAMFALSLILSGLLVYAVSQEFNDWRGMYAAFGQNLMMSALFIFMFLQRDGLCGQSIYIALFKMIGTILPSYLFYSFLEPSLLMNTLFIAIFVLDALYVILIYNRARKLGINVWQI